MKKTIAVLLLLALLIPFTLCGCGEKEKTPDLPEDISAEAAESADETEPSSALSSGLLGSVPMRLDGAGILLYVEGMITGTIRPAESKLSGEERNAIPAITFEEGMEVPYDKESGYPVGAYGVLPVTFTCALDETYAAFRKIASRGEQLTVTADYYRLKTDGTLEKYYTVSYEDVLIISVGTVSAAGNGSSNSFAQQTKVSFTYQRAVFTFADGSESYTENR